MDNKDFSCKEEFYNFKDLCDAALHKDPVRTKKILEAQSGCLFESGADEAGMMVFLTSMNRGFYNYILYTMNLSLHRCCHDNLCFIHHCRSRDDFFAAAAEIIHAYCGQLAAAPRDNLYILRAKEYIARNLDKNLRLEEVAAHVYISKAYLSELFTACTGKTFSAYVTELRMERAGQLLRSTTLSIHDVGVACGFFSPAYFSTVFREHFGVSPRQYRSTPARESRHTA